MLNKLIISAYGPDRKGIVSEISAIISNNNGNIETSKMIRLEDQFSILMLIEINSNKTKELKNELQKIKKLEIDVKITNYNNKNDKNK